MPINAQANEIEDYTSTTGGDWRYNTNASDIQSAFLRAGPYLYSGDLSNHLRRSLPSAVTTQCITAWVGRQDEWDDHTVVFFGFTSGGTPVLGLQATITTGVVNLVSWNGSSWDVLAAGVKPALDVATRFDILLENYGAGDATERCRVWARYPNGAAPPFLMIDFSGDCTTPTITDVDGTFQAAVHPDSGNINEKTVSQLIAADEPTLRMGLVTCYIAGPGDEAWEAGTWEDIDQATPSLATFIETATAGDKFFANITPLPSSTTITPLTAQVSILAALGATGPTKIKLGVKSDGVEYWGPDISLTIVPAMYQLLLTQDPTTGPASAWTTAKINALQIGVQAVA